MILAQTSDDVLHVDDGIVNERADGDGHTAERHRVDASPRIARSTSTAAASDNGIARQRDRCSAPVGEKQQPR